MTSFEEGIKFSESIQNGNLNEVKLAVENGQRINTYYSISSYSICSPLGDAIYFNREDIVLYLLEKEANPYDSGKFKQSSSLGELMYCQNKNIITKVLDRCQELQGKYNFTEVFKISIKYFLSLVYGENKINFFYNFTLKELIMRGLEIHRKIEGESIFDILDSEFKEEIFLFCSKNIKPAKSKV